MQTLTLLVPRPAEPSRLDRFLVACLHGVSRRAVKGILDAGQVRVGGRVERKAGRTLQPGEEVQLTLRPSWLPTPELAAEAVIARGDGWLAVHKPAGLPSHRPDDDVGGVPEALGALGIDGAPVHRLDRATSGVLLVATADDAASRLSVAFAERRVHKEYRAVVSPGPTADAGERSDSLDGHPCSMRWEVLRRQGDRAELVVFPREGRTHQIRRQLALAGCPIVGDLLYGRPVPGGAPRMALHCVEVRVEDVGARCEPEASWELLLRPEATSGAERGSKGGSRGSKGSTGGGPAKAPPRRSGRSLPTLQVSSATARVLAGGHPWVLPDRDTGDLRGFSAGDQAQLVDPRGRELGVALIDPRAGVVARALDSEHALTDDDFTARAERALSRRKAVLDDPRTDCMRLVNGEADGLPGLVVDRWSHLLVATRATRAAAAFTAPVYRALRARFPGAALWERDHVVDLRARRDAGEGDALPGRWVGAPGPEEQSLTVREHGLRYRVEPFAGLTVGFYPDQRDNRQRMAERPLAGARVCNLFAHTGAFSVFAAAHGAERAVSVDLSPRYCAWAEENLRLNGLDPAQHPAIADAADRWLEQTDERFDGVVLDPPAFARGRSGVRGWSAKRDYARLVEAAARRVVPGGWILCVINLKGLDKRWLPREVGRGAKAAGRRVVDQQPAPPPVDHPNRRGFPEGRAFWGVFATLD